MSPRTTPQQIRRRFLELVSIMFFGVIVAFANLLKGFEMFFPGEPEGSKNGDDVS